MTMAKLAAAALIILTLGALKIGVANEQGADQWRGPLSGYIVIVRL